MVRLNSNEFCTLGNQPHLRGHKYVTENLANVVITEEMTFLVIESLTYGITCRSVQEILLVSTSLTSHLVIIIFCCTVNYILSEL